MKKSTLLLTLAALFLMTLTAIHAAAPEKVEANQVKEISLVSSKAYANPFMEVELDAVVTRPDGKQLRVPAFWAGGNDWKFRYASELTGTHSWKTECKDAANAGLHGVSGTIEVVPSTSDNPLYKHGPIRVSQNKRHFEHADHTPFLWLGDTWWKALCKRLTWEGFQELTADRKAKGFSVVQIVCGPYPDEGFFQPTWGNEGGMPYETKDFTVINPTYFKYSDRRIIHLADAGLVPAIVGGWGRGDCDGMRVGVEGIKRHWRNIIARYGAYPAVWLIGGEASGPKWTEVARYVRQTDPFERIVTMHPHDSARRMVTDESVLDFDMLQTGHGDWDKAHAAAPKVKAGYERTPKMPVMIGEHSYEGLMQTGFPDIQRHVFWSSMLSGAAGHTYGAAGIWHVGVEAEHGNWGAWGGKPYDYTTWKEGMVYPGSTQVGLGRKLLERYPWQRFEPHPEWTSPGSYAAGIPGELRFIYHPKGRIFDWTGTVVKELEPGVGYSAFYFDPATGRRFDQGIIRSETGEFKTKEVPTPQDWVLVMERAQTKPTDLKK